MAYATQTMRNAAADFERRVGAVCSGIVGDSAHNYGYHRAANEIGSGDYSRQLPGDVNGIDWSAADAIDMSMTREKMILVTGRYYASWKSHEDLRLNYFREIIGTLDGRNVIYMDTQSGKQGSSDTSHLWHLHSGGLRCNVNNPWAWKAWVSIGVGESWADYCRLNPDDPITHGAAPAPAPAPAPRPAGLDVDGDLGPKTITRWQQIMGTPADGVIDRDRPSLLVTAVQRTLNAKIGAGLRVDGYGIAQDGHAYQTVRALQRYLGTYQDGVLSKPKSQCVEALQRRLNAGWF